jgi:hypothetical protein
LAQHFDCRGVSDFRRSLGGIRRLQQGKPISPNGGRELLPVRVGFGEPIVLHPVAVAFTPCWLHVGPQPRWGSAGEAVQGVTHRFPDQFQPVERPDGRQNMGGIGPLRPPRFEEIAFLQTPQQRLQEQVLSFPLEEPRAELTQDGGIKPWISEFQA